MCSARSSSARARLRVKAYDRNSLSHPALQHRGRTGHSQHGLSQGLPAGVQMVSQSRIAERRTAACVLPAEMSALRRVRGGVPAKRHRPGGGRQFDRLFGVHALRTLCVRLPGRRAGDLWAGDGRGRGRAHRVARSELLRHAGRRDALGGRAVRAERVCAGAFAAIPGARHPHGARYLRRVRVGADAAASAVYRSGLI